MNVKINCKIQYLACFQASDSEDMLIKMMKTTIPRIAVHASVHNTLFA